MELIVTRLKRAKIVSHFYINLQTFTITVILRVEYIFSEKVGKFVSGQEDHPRIRSDKGTVRVIHPQFGAYGPTKTSKELCSVRLRHILTDRLRHM